MQSADHELGHQVALEDIWLAQELLEAGWSSRDITRARRAGLIHRVRHGAYVDAALWQSSDELDRHRLIARAVLKRAHPSSVLSHHSALAELRVPLWGLDLKTVHLTRLDGNPRRSEAGIVHHGGSLAESEVVQPADVPIVRADRAAFEITTYAPVEQALAVVNSLLNAGHTSLNEIAAYADAGLRWPNSLATTVVLRLADHRVQSVAESRFCYLCYRQHLPKPEPQVPVYGESGGLVGVVDFLWRKQGVFLEFDGRIKYELFRRPGESLADYLMREKRREELICQLTGWVCIRIGWSDLENPHTTARRIRAILDSRSDISSPIGHTG